MAALPQTEDSFVRVESGGESNAAPMEDLDITIETTDEPDKVKAKKKQSIEIEVPTRARPVGYVFVLTGIAALNSANLGFDIGACFGV